MACRSYLNIDYSEEDSGDDFGHASSSASISCSEKPKSFEFKKWNAIAFWTWNVAVDTCAICRSHLTELCIECQALGAKWDLDCGVAWGICNHAFHCHCISRWLKTRDVCPLDNDEWVFRRYGR